MPPTASVVMASYRRPQLLAASLASLRSQTFQDIEIIVTQDGMDKDETEQVCAQYGAVYQCRTTRPNLPYSNHAVPMNMSIRAARGRILIIQTTGCVHAARSDNQKLVEPHIQGGKLAVFAACRALNADGSFEKWHSHSLHAANRGVFACGSILRSSLVALGGYEEGFPCYGFEDDWLHYCMRAAGMGLMYRDDIVVEHLWHERDHAHMGMERNEAAFRRLLADHIAAKVPAIGNFDREWGIDHLPATYGEERNADS